MTEPSRHRKFRGVLTKPLYSLVFLWLRYHNCCPPQYICCHAFFDLLTFAGYFDEYTNCESANRMMLSPLDEERMKSTFFFPLRTRDGQRGMMFFLFANTQRMKDAADLPFDGQTAVLFVVFLPFVRGVNCCFRMRGLDSSLACVANEGDTAT